MNGNMKGIKKCVEANTDVLRYKILQALQHKNKRIKELENTKRLLETENKCAFDTIGRLLEEKEMLAENFVETNLKNEELRKENVVILHKLNSMTDKENASIKRVELCQMQIEELQQQIADLKETNTFWLFLIVSAQKLILIAWA